nr:MAG TPA: hypothetical protein [Caudoviricetes sp.]
MLHISLIHNFHFFHTHLFIRIHNLNLRFLSIYLDVSISLKKLVVKCFLIKF